LCYERNLYDSAQWEAAGFLGMSEKTLRDIYGHHHPDSLMEAADAIGRRKPVSLVNAVSDVKNLHKPLKIWTQSQSNLSPLANSLLTGKLTGNFI
jgi:hypothetical protein